MEQSGDAVVDGEAVKRDMLIAFEYAHNEDDWVFPLSDALAGVSSEDALWKPTASDAKQRCIWEIVLHMAVWNENVVQRMENRQRKEPMSRPQEGAWPALPATTDEAAWEEAKRRLWASLSAMRNQIETTHMAMMLDYGEAGYSQFDDLLCRFFHNAYHIGQMVKMREFQAAQRSSEKSVQPSP